MLEVVPPTAESDSKTLASNSGSVGIEKFLGRVLNQVQLGVKQLKRNQKGSILTNILNQSTDVGTSNLNNTNLKDISASFIQKSDDGDGDDNG